MYNVIDIFQELRFYNFISPPKKPIEKKPKPNKPSPLITDEEYMAALLNNCLQLIDMEAKNVLTYPKMLDLRFEELEIIVKRDALQMNSEMLLFDLLVNWSGKECEKKGLDVSSENRRRILGGLCYTPRYLNMGSQEFTQACNRAELLDFGETQLVKEHFKNKKPSNITTEQIVMLSNFKKARPEYAKLPIYLSARSDPKNYPKKMRKYDRDPDAGCCDGAILTCVGIFASIFD